MSCWPNRGRCIDEVFEESRVMSPSSFRTGESCTVGRHEGLPAPARAARRRRQLWFRQSSQGVMVVPPN